ncbi:MAG: F0F1 ATP synthase subunit delta [Actinomycetota bacterium]|nr:F0F1 ATP synthase subunit delta [Actinomycetota bacterium]
MSDWVHGASSESRAAMAQRLDEAVATGADPARVGSDLFAVAVLLDSQASLRRILTDPARSGESQGRLLRDILGDRIDPAALDVAAVGASRRWTRVRHLADAFEHFSVVAAVIAAEQSGQADELEDELFRFERIVVGEPGLREALGDRSVPVDHRAELVRSLLGDRAGAQTVQLVEQGLTGRHRSLTVALQEYQKVAAERRERMVATVRVARPLAEDDKHRLAEALHRQYGRPVHLNVVVDEEVLGGLRVEIGDEVIDGTVASRLEEARRRLAG